jgi:hypothetical protein
MAQAQIIVDPNNRGNPAGQKAIAQLPPLTRKFGFVPDLGHCKPGDLILSCSAGQDKVPKKIESLIFSTQLEAGFHEDHSRWTHAMVYLYEDFVVEADDEMGVHSRSLYSDVPSCLFKVRRRPNLKDEERYKIALCAQRMLGMRYDRAAALNLGLRARLLAMWNRYWVPRTDPPAIICSQVFYDAHAAITQHLLADCLTYPIMPAHLSATPDLDGVSVPWLTVI